MNKHRFILTAISFLFVLVSWCQLNIYKTYADFVAHAPKEYGNVEFKKWKGNENTVLVFGGKGKEDREVECANIWGFSYNNVLFRVSKDSKYFVKKGGVQLGTPFVVMLLDDVVYYENGLGILDAMKQERTQAVLKGMCAVLSKDLDSDMAMVPCYPAKWTDEQVLLLVGAYPELKDLAGVMEAFKKSQSPLSTGSFSNYTVSRYVKEYIENKKK